MLTHLQTFELKDFVPEIVTCHYQNDANLIGAAANFQAKRIIKKQPIVILFNRLFLYLFALSSVFSSAAIRA